MRKVSLIFVWALLCKAASAQERYDVVISEIMADPLPAVGLPGNEWIELRNTTATAINLQNWRIGDASGQSGPLPNYILPAGAAVIVCTGSAVPAMSAFGSTVSVTSFPSLDNAGDQLFLRSSSGKTIHAVAYELSWYKNDIKKDGGWTLEMVDVKNPCSGSDNWKASEHPSGGTPATINSVNAINTDKTPPLLQRAYTTASNTIVLVFNEPLDSLSGATLSNYTGSNGLSWVKAINVAPLFNTVQITTASPLNAGTVYTIAASGIKDCSGNSINTTSVKTGLPAGPVQGDCVINELLFNPRSGGFDYAELYNSSEKIIDVSQLYVANRNSSGIVGSATVITTTPLYLFPGEYIALTEDATSLALQYHVKDPQTVIVTTLPSLPDDEGDLIVLDFQGLVVDEVNYKDDWHFKLIDDKEGVALERIDPAAGSNDPGNWHSAASTAGYGTPGYKNSQYKRTDDVNATITITPVVFSPDNDGRDDIVSIQYRMEEAGFVANITIFNAAGRTVHYLVRNGLLGLSGYWNWDGLDDKKQQLPVGIYIVYTELFNLQGKKKRFKNTVVLARPLR